jgi:NADH:ubiquinone oxidoreductase subunit 4 (subunit M)
MFAIAGVHYSLSLDDIASKFILLNITLYPLSYWWWNVYRKDKKKLDEQTNSVDVS